MKRTKERGNQPLIKVTGPTKIVRNLWEDANSFEIQYGKMLTDYWDKPNTYWGYRSLMSFFITTASTCCGFMELHEFYDPVREDKKLFDKHYKEIVTLFKEALEKCPHPFLTAYVPNKKGYILVKKLLADVGFVPGVTLPTRHAGRKYTNTRWEWYHPKKKVIQYEKTVRSASK